MSHIFILKEILGLRQLGLEIETASVNPPDRPGVQLPHRETEEAFNSYCLKQSSVWEAPSAVVTVTFGMSAGNLSRIQGQ
jgi:hypothetical protein